MTSTAAPLNQIEQWVYEYGDALYRYAMSRLQNTVVAEDIVQETFLAALKSGGRFTGRASAQTWLIGILKHKIIDYIRKASRERPVTEIEVDDVLAETLFDSKGQWRVGPQEWQVNPEKILEQKEFLAVLNHCLEKLPERLRDAFSLRELDDQKTEEICKVLDITPTNLWVLLHRARLRLQHCLTENWFATPEGRG
ncbi:MAG: sigma-70 family RNA polymerase sigma factor [Verrucomicrobia bacterium]|nr:MAG: sigma-70 family RNA polymerase sigma factor [Verrucomicrobiota bacterium]